MLSWCADVGEVIRRVPNACRYENPDATGWKASFGIGCVLVPFVRMLSALPALF